MPKESNSEGLEDQWNPWLKRSQLEKPGFRSIDSVPVSHKAKRVGESFTIYFVLLPKRKDSEPPTWDKKKLIEGAYFCMAHRSIILKRTSLRRFFENYDPTRTEPFRRVDSQYVSPLNNPYMNI